MTTRAPQTEQAGSYGFADGPHTSYKIGEAESGVVASEYGNGYHHVTRLTVNVTNAMSTGDNASLGTGALLYTFPAGEIIVESAYMSMGLTATVEQAADTPDIGLGTVIATGAVATLDGTATFENLITGQTAADAAGTASVVTTLLTAGTPLLIPTASAHTVHFNAADAWADDTSADLTCDIAGVVVLKWQWMG